MTHTEESLIALSEACTVAAVKVPYLGATNYSESVDALRLAIREVLAEFANVKMHDQATGIQWKAQYERAEKAEAERDALRKLLNDFGYSDSYIDSMKRPK